MISDAMCSKPQVKVNAKRPLVAFFHCNGLFKATPNPYKAQDEWAKGKLRLFWGEAFPLGKGCSMFCIIKNYLKNLKGLVLPAKPRQPMLPNFQAKVRVKGVAFSSKTSKTPAHNLMAR